MKCQVALHMGPKFVGDSSAMHGPFGTGVVEDGARRKGRCPATQFGVCEDSEKSSRSSDARQYRYWAPVLEKFVKGTAAGHLVNPPSPVAQDFGAQALCREHMHDIAADYCSST